LRDDVERVEIRCDLIAAWLCVAANENPGARNCAQHQLYQLPQLRKHLPDMACGRPKDIAARLPTPPFGACIGNITALGCCWESGKHECERRKGVVAC
jgi:hypothetical protein